MTIKITNFVFHRGEAVPNGYKPTPSPRGRGRTFDKAFFDKERLVNLFQRSGIFSQGSRDSRQSYRSAVKLVDDSRQQLIVDLIQAVTVDVQCLQSIAGNRLIDLRILSPVQNHAHDAATRSLYRCTTTTGSYLACSTQLAFHIQDIGTTQHDLRQRLHLVIFEVHIDPETRPERTCQQTAASRRPTSVNGARSIWMERALGPLSIMISIR